MNTPVVCRLFGTQVRTVVRPHVARDGDGSVTLDIMRASDEPELEALGVPRLSYQMLHPDGPGLYEMWSQGTGVVLRIAPVAEFRCIPNRIEFRPLKELSEEALQWQTFGLAMTVWSEWVGHPVLHAASVEVEGSAVGLLGHSGTGKSSLTVEFLTHGHRVFGDDLLVMDRISAPTIVRAVPSLPWLKVGPVIAAAAGFDFASLPVLHPVVEKRLLALPAGMWPDAPLPLGPLYVLERGQLRPEVLIEPMAPAESLGALLKYSFAPRTVAAAGLSARRLSILAEAVEQAGVWRLRYPDGIEWLPHVRAAVIRHQLERVSESPAQFRR